MKNYVQPGKTLTLTAPYDVASGGGAQVGSVFGVAASAVASGARGEFDVVGVFDLAKTTGAAWTEGELLYWDNSAKTVTASSNSGANLKIGIAVANDAIGTMALSADAVGRVRLNGAF